MGLFSKIALAFLAAHAAGKSSDPIVVSPPHVYGLGVEVSSSSSRVESYFSFINGTPHYGQGIPRHESGLAVNIAALGDGEFPEEFIPTLTNFLTINGTTGNLSANVTLIPSYAVVSLEYYAGKIFGIGWRNSDQEVVVSARHGQKYLSKVPKMAKMEKTGDNTSGELFVIDPTNGKVQTLTNTIPIGDGGMAVGTLAISASIHPTKGSSPEDCNQFTVYYSNLDQDENIHIIGVTVPSYEINDWIFKKGTLTAIAASPNSTDLTVLTYFGEGNEIDRMNTTSGELTLLATFPAKYDTFAQGALDIGQDGRVVSIANSVETIDNKTQNVQSLSVFDPRSNETHYYLANTGEVVGGLWYPKISRPPTSCKLEFN